MEDSKQSRIQKLFTEIVTLIWKSDVHNGKLIVNLKQF